MNETQRNIKAYKAALPGLKERVFAVALLLVMSVAMLTSATFAWITLSRAPEVTAVNTNIAANGNLEIALATGDGKTPPGDSQVGDSSATEGQSISAANLTWGNLINLSDPSYGLDNLALRPAQLNTAALLTKPLYGAVYDSDGRIKNLTSNYGYTAWIPEADGKAAHFGVSDDMGVRAISSIKREQLGYTADYSTLYESADIANVIAQNTYTDITVPDKHDGWMDVLAKLLGIHMTATLNYEDQYINASITPEDMATLIDMYEEFILAHTQEADAIAKQLNLELYAAYGGDITKYTPYSQADILAINPNSDSRIRSNGDFSYDVLDSNNVTKTIKITNMKAFLKDYAMLQADLAKLNQIDEAKDYRWTASGLQKVVERLMDVNKCLIKKHKGESTFKTVKELMSEFSSNPVSALGYKDSECDIMITNGVLYNLEQRVGSRISVKGMKVTAKMYVNTMNLGEVTANVYANVTTSATSPGDFYTDLAYVDDTLNTGADTSSGDAVAEDTYALAVDFWVRTNAVGSFLTLEGNVILGDPYEVPIMTEDDNGEQVPLYSLSRTYEDEETGETTMMMIDVYKKEANGTVTWYNAISHTQITDEELGDSTPIAQVEEKRDVIGYEGENRVWDKENKQHLLPENTTQGMGSCYVYYADTPEDQARSMELLKAFNVAFVDQNGYLLATASMDTEHFYGNSGRFVVPLVMNDDGIMLKGNDENGEEVITYAITSLQQNTPTRITAIVYLDGTILNNEDVLAAADIQGQLNIQFGNNAEMQPIDNEKLEYETRKVTATVDNTSFDFDTYEGDMISNVTVHVDGDAPTNVTAFFQRKINSTQGSREKEMAFTKNGNSWVASHKFLLPGEYILRTVSLDGMEYVLAEPPVVKINGFTIASLSCDEADDDRHVEILTEASYEDLNLKLQFASSDPSKLPSTVQGRFIRDDDGSAVSVDFTYNATTNIWSGKAFFPNSGEYTLQYLVLNGQYEELELDQQITANIKLGMKVAVYTTSSISFKFVPSEMVANGTDQLHMQVKIMDNADKELSGQENVKLTYRLYRSASTIDVDLDWNPVSRYYEGDIQALDAGPGNWVFDSVSIGQANTITNDTTSPEFELISPEPPSLVETKAPAEFYAPNAEANMTARLKYSNTSTVAATFTDAGGKYYAVMGTKGTTDGDNITDWTFTLPKNASGDYSGKQDGYWTMQDIYVWNYYTSDGTYVEWKKDETTGKPLGELVVNNDGTLAADGNRDDANAMTFDVSGDNRTTRVVQTIKMDFTKGTQSADFGKTGNDVTGVFMTSYPVNDLRVTITDFEGKPVATDVKYTVKYDNNTSEKYGGYTNNDLKNSAIVYETAMTADANGTTFTQAKPFSLVYAGSYTTTFTYTIKVGATTAAGDYEAKNIVKSGLPAKFTVSSVKPSVTVSVSDTTTSFPTRITWTKNWRGALSYTLSENKKNSSAINTVTVYAKASTGSDAESVGSGDAGFVRPKLTFTAAEIDSSTKVTFTIPKGDSKADINVSLDGTTGKEYTLGSTAEVYSSWSIFTYSVRGYFGHKDQTIKDVSITKNGVTVTVTLDQPIVIHNPSSVNKTS